MNSWLTINPDNQGNQHLLFYLLALVTVVVIITAYGLRKKIPLTPLILLLFSTFLFSILGGKLFSFGFDEWLNILKTHQIPETRNKTILGYLIFGVIGFYLTRYLLKFKYPVGTAFAFAWPVGLIVTRLGCLTGGCCYGSVTHSVLGISYAKGSLAYNSQLFSGLIQSNQTVSLPVHPVPLYEIIYCVLILFILYSFYKKRILKHESSLFFLSIILYGIFRFFEEFIRPGQTGILGLQKAQVISIILFILSTGFVFIAEKYRKGNKESERLVTDINRYIFVLSGLLLLLIYVSNWLTFTELVFLQLFSYAALFITSMNVVQALKIKVAYALPSLMVFMAFLFMSQTLSTPLDSVFTSKKYFTIGAGGNYGLEEEICGDVNEYSAFGMNLEYTNEYKKDKKFSFGSQLYTINYDYANYLGFTPYVKWDSRFIGGKLGINLSYLETEYKSSGIIPSLALRIGPENVFFADAHYADYLPGELPAFQAGIGIGLRNHPGNYVRLGISEAGFYLNPKFMLNDNFSLDPFLAYSTATNYQLALRIHYTFYEK
ncbi:prolipoprotein diacylglyceryl transferase [Saccharicrinis sp. FJH62]|uniref:prolipoprotein diacylglyceryl transferase n=1 Tax=Saccharicrinis sp. FJH62 TaxID=3344657 RepID=UPI0035D4D8F9